VGLRTWPHVNGVGGCGIENRDIDFGRGWRVLAGIHGREDRCTLFSMAFLSQHEADSVHGLSLDH
jgi:hypothetical protein